MTPPNPAIELYNYWRSFVRYRCEHAVATLKSNTEEYLNERRLGHAKWEDARTDVETHTRQNTDHYNSPDVKMDYRMGLRIVGLTDRHLWNESTLLEWDLGPFEPIIQLVVHYRSGRTIGVMSVWPNGDFRMDTPPQEGLHQIYPRWTFLRTSWVASSRAWLPAQPDLTAKYPWQPDSGWVNIDVRDWHKAVPFVLRRTFVRGANYRLAWDGNYWKIISQYGCDDGSYQFDTDVRAKNLLKAAYDACEKRYDRYRRLSITGTTEAKINRVAIYVPKHGRMTGLEAVQQFSQHMRVYEPAEAVKEATDASDSMVTSAVSQ